MAITNKKLEEIAEETRGMFTTNNSTPQISRKNSIAILTYKDNAKAIIDTGRKIITYISSDCIYVGPYSN